MALALFAKYVFTEMTKLIIQIPCFNEEDALPATLSALPRKIPGIDVIERLIVDDGSTDKSWSIIQEIYQKDSRMKGVSFRRNYGKSAALNTGFQRVNGRVVITMDADLQDNPNEIPELYSMILEKDLDIVSGWKKQRRDISSFEGV